MLCLCELCFVSFDLLLSQTGTWKITDIPTISVIVWPPEGEVEQGVVVDHDQSVPLKVQTDPQIARLVHRRVVRLVSPMWTMDPTLVVTWYPNCCPFCPCCTYHFCFWFIRRIERVWIDARQYIKSAFFQTAYTSIVTNNVLYRIFSTLLHDNFYFTCTPIYLSNFRCVCVCVCVCACSTYLICTPNHKHCFYYSKNKYTIVVW